MSSLPARRTLLIDGIKGLHHTRTQLTKAIPKLIKATTNHALIGAAQSVEHYEISRYSTALSFAFSLGESRVTGLCPATLDEEGKANNHLTALYPALDANAFAKTKFAKRAPPASALSTHFVFSSYFL